MAGQIVVRKQMLNKPSPEQIAFGLIVFFAAIHLIMGGLIPLSTDEAHYALYGYYPALSYFDHPSMVGWLQALALLISEQEWSLRLFPILIHAAVSVLLYRYTNRWFEAHAPRAGLLALGLYYSAAIVQIIGMGLVPDGPLILFALLTVNTTYELLEKDDWKYWLQLGLWLGLAGISKYTAITFAFSFVLAFLLLGQWQRLFSLKAIVAALIALMVIAPVLCWNYQHDWLSFRYQIEHGTSNDDWQLLKAMSLQAMLIVGYGPFVYFIGLFAIFAALRQRSVITSLLLIFAFPVLFLFSYAAGKGQSFPHWTISGFALLCPVMAFLLLERWNRKPIRFLTWVSLGYGVLTVGLVHLLIAVPIPFPANMHPAKDLIGWDEAAERAITLNQEYGYQERPIIFTQKWYYASRLAWYARPTPVIVLDNRYDQMDIWYGSPEPGMSGILVYPTEGDDKQLEQLGDFEDCKKIDDFNAMRAGRIVETFEFYHCQMLWNMTPYR
jgi:4-amino-4-deoxy-L-arabinose transferase-like glycosyltransferase